MRFFPRAGEVLISGETYYYSCLMTPMPAPMPVARLGTGRARRGCGPRAQGAQSKCQEQCSQNSFVHDFPLALWATRWTSVFQSRSSLVRCRWIDSYAEKSPYFRRKNNDKKDESKYLFTLGHCQILLQIGGKVAHAALYRVRIRASPCSWLAPTKS